MTSVLEGVAAYMSRDADDDGLLSLHLLDTVGAWFAGHLFSEGREIIGSLSGPLSPLPGGLLDDIAREVAITRLTEVDDIHRASCVTCGSVIVPTVLLLAEATGADGGKIARAMTHGYEGMMRLGMAVNGPAILSRGVWPTYLAAPFGAAATAAVLLDLDRAQAAQALALALQQTSGAPGGHPHGKTARWLLSGFAARSGVASAMMAARGYVGDLTLLNGDWMARTHGLALDPEALRNPAPLLHETSFKPWCCAKQTTSAIHAFQSLLADGGGAAAIARVTVAVPGAYRAMISSQPPGRLGRIVNIGWQLGLAAHAPEAMGAVDREIGVKSRAVEDFAARVEVVADAELDLLYPRKWPARVRVTLADGRSRERLCEDAWGDPELPLGEHDVLAKFELVTQRRASSLAAHLRRPVRELDAKALMTDFRALLA